MYQYSFDIKKFENSFCCLLKYNEKTAILFTKNNRFLSPVIKEKDRYFLSLIYILDTITSLRYPDMMLTVL